MTRYSPLVTLHSGVAIIIQLSKAKEGKFNGTIDEIRIYDRALSEAEIKESFAAEGLAVAPDKLALTWGWVKFAK